MMMNKRSISIAQVLMRSFHKVDKSRIEINYTPAVIGQNVHPNDLSPEDVLKTIDPKTISIKEPSYEFKDPPLEGEEKNETHIMHLMAPFPNTDNDIGKEYGFKIKGLEPTRYGDWERKGRCTDF